MKLVRPMSSVIETRINKVLLIVTSSASMLLVILILSRYNIQEIQEIQLFQGAASPPFDFVPAAPSSLSDCDELFGPGTAVASFQLSPEYHAHFPDFEAAVNRSTVDEEFEGFSFQQPTQFKVLHYLASRPHVRRVCETGFNLGHSSFSHLTANRDVVVHSFDLGVHQYAHKMATFMARQFPGRIFVHFGNSTQTVPEFVLAHPAHRCQFIYVDGGHTYPVAMADLLNLAAMADVDSRNVIMFDDYPTLKAFARSFGWAWENMRRWGYVRELMRCSFGNKQFQRGFVIGTVLRRHIHRQN